MEIRSPIVDADAHVVEDQESSYRPFLPEAFQRRTGSFFPRNAWDIELDGTLGKLHPSNPATYLQDMDAERIATQVLYPSNALTIGLIREPDWETALAPADNPWLTRLCTT